MENCVGKEGLKGSKIHFPQNILFIWMINEIGKSRTLQGRAGKKGGKGKKREKQKGRKRINWLNSIKIVY